MDLCFEKNSDSNRLHWDIFYNVLKLCDSLLLLGSVFTNYYSLFMRVSMVIWISEWIINCYPYSKNISMWLKLLLLTLYLLFLFILSRILETASWYQDTEALFSTFAALDPLTLSVKKLKQILDSRGISYSGVVEKPELIELVESSGRFHSILLDEYLDFCFIIFAVKFSMSIS